MTNVKNPDLTLENQSQKTTCTSTGDLVYTPYITVKGKRIYHPTGGVFVFPADPTYRKTKHNTTSI
jgi:hypothetical protein